MLVILTQRKCQLTLSLGSVFLQKQVGFSV